MLRCNRPVFHYHGVLKPMTVKQRTSFSFDASSLLLFAALSLGSAAAFAQVTAPKAAASATPAESAAKNQGTLQAFTKADTNHDGRLTPQEAASLPAVAAKFKQFDTDKDGKLSYSEFAKGVSQQP